jgi:hypothetical protein
MKKLISLIVFVLFNLCLWSQNDNLDYKYAVKLYNQTTFENYGKTESDSIFNHYVYTDKRLQVLHPTFAFQWKTSKNNFHEVELTSFSLTKVETGKEVKNDTSGIYETISGAEVVTTYISVQYEFILNLNKSNPSKFVPSVGFAINPYYRQGNYIPKVTDSFRTSENYIGARAFIIPRLTYYFSQKFFIDLNISMCMFDSYYLSAKDLDPRLTVEEGIKNSFNLELFPKIFSARLGIGLKL